MEKENILSILYRRIYSYFTLRPTRKVFFFFMCACALSAITSVISGWIFAAFALVVCAIVTIGASILDTRAAREEFMGEVYSIEYDFFLKRAEEVGEKAAIEGGGLFSDDERKHIKRKKREFTGSIIIKVALMIFLVVMLFNLV